MHGRNARRIVAMTVALGRRHRDRQFLHRLVQYGHLNGFDGIDAGHGSSASGAHSRPFKTSSSSRRSAGELDPTFGPGAPFTLRLRV